jgi:hypothetical protein
MESAKWQIVIYWTIDVYLIGAGLKVFEKNRRQGEKAILSEQRKNVCSIYTILIP